MAEEKKDLAQARLLLDREEQALFCRRVSRAFQNSAIRLPADELLSILNEDGDKIIEQDKFDARLIALDQDNRIMIQKRSEEETLVWLV